MNQKYKIKKPIHNIKSNKNKNNNSNKGINNINIILFHQIYYKLFKNR